MMKPSYPHSILTLLFYLLLVSAAPDVFADDSDEAKANDRWYQIDLIVFKNLSAAAELEEQWRKDLHLRYPDNLIKLKSAKEYAGEACAIENNPAIKDEMDQFSCLEQLTEDPTSQWPPAYKTATQAQDAAMSNPVSASTDNSDVFNPPPPFVLLSQADEEIQESQRSLNRSSLYRVIFSGSWAQELSGREDSPHILIQGGEGFDEHFELEGHIKISLERYLHVATDLWLSRFQPIPQQLMNRPTWGPGATQYTDSLNSRSIWPLLPIPFAQQEQEPDLQPEPEEAPLNAQTGFQPGEMSDPSDNMPRSNLEALIADDKQYYVERTVVMQQQRRMRSDELHFIDHPLFGVLVKITPLPREKETASR